MLKRLIKLIQAFGCIIPIIAFLAFIIADEGDQYTISHLFATVISTIPLLFTMMINYIIYGRWFIPFNE